MTLLMLLIILFISLPLKIEISFIISPCFILGQILTAVKFLLGSISFRRQLLIAVNYLPRHTMNALQFSKLVPGAIIPKRKFRIFFQYTTSKFFPDLFDNQHDFGKRISERFIDRSIHTVLAVAPTQSGKTGSMLATIKYFLESPSLSLPFQNIFIITGHSSTEWTQQTKQRFPIQFRDNIFHRNQLKSFVHKVKTLRNVLIFIDESHIAARKHQSVQAALRDAGISDQALFDNDIKIVLVTATPNLCIKHYLIHDTLSMDVPNNYRSIQSLVDDGLVFTAKDLSLPSSISNIHELYSFISSSPKFHIIRTPRAKGFHSTIDNFVSVFGTNDFDYMLSPTDFDFLSSPPTKHTFVFIIDRLRCAKTIHKDHIGILYERSPKVVNSDSIIQGLLGRATGFHKAFPIVFTHF